MRCEEIMKRHPRCVSPDDSVESAAWVMRDEDVGFLPVCDPETNACVGTLTDRDITLRIVAEGRTGDTRVDEVMTREIVGCHPEDDVHAAEDAMGLHKKSRILVLEDAGTVLGVISLSDIAQLEEDPRRMAETMREITQREAHA